MTEKFLFTFERIEYKTIEVEGIEVDQGIKYNEPYVSMVEELQKDGWYLTPQVKRVE